MIRGTFEQAQGDTRKALQHAQKANESLSKPPFEILANLANCQIEMLQLSEAGKTLHDLQARFPNTHHDAKIGLRCKLEIRRGDINLADTLWTQIREKETGVHMGLRLALLNRTALAQPLSPLELAEQQKILDKIKDVDWKRTERLLGSIVTSEE